MQLGIQGKSNEVLIRGSLLECPVGCSLVSEGLHLEVGATVLEASERPANLQHEIIFGERMGFKNIDVLQVINDDVIPGQILVNRV